MKLIAFDLDNTLAKFNQPASQATVDALLDFEKQGVRIAILSGKPTSYLCGFVRQIGLKKAIISGENGVMIQYGAEFPPSQFYFTIELDKQSNQAFRAFEGILKEKFDGDVWFQPNIVNITAFPVRKEIHADLFAFFHAYVDEHKQEFNGLKIYEHVDAIELVPRNVDKGVVLRKIMEIEQIDKDQVCAVGDSESDLPMFEQVENSIIIGVGHAKFEAGNIDGAIKEIKRILQLS